jgi:hypothetical protein
MAPSIISTHLHSVAIDVAVRRRALILDVPAPRTRRWPLGDYDEVPGGVNQVPFHAPRRRALQRLAAEALRVLLRRLEVLLRPDVVAAEVLLHPVEAEEELVQAVQAALPAVLRLGLLLELPEVVHGGVHVRLVGAGGEKVLLLHVRAARAVVVRHHPGDEIGVRKNNSATDKVSPYVMAR